MSINKSSMLEFEIRTGKITIDRRKCVDCKTYACAKACSLYGRMVYRIQGGLPALTSTPEEVKERLCIECLACELDCNSYGKNAIKITLPVKGLDEYRKKIGMR